MRAIVSRSIVLVRLAGEHSFDTQFGFWQYPVKGRCREEEVKVKAELKALACELEIKAARPPSSWSFDQ